MEKPFLKDRADMGRRMESKEDMGIDRLFDFVGILNPGYPQVKNCRAKIVQNRCTKRSFIQLQQLNYNNAVSGLLLLP